MHASTASSPVTGEPRPSRRAGRTKLVIAPHVLEPIPAPLPRFTARVRSNGVLLRAQARGLAISPPLIVTVEQIREVADAVHAGLESLASVGAPA
jgi:acetylornithine/succinyldiaminopimelate/putrescine aminotransferase